MSEVSPQPGPWTRLGQAAWRGVLYVAFAAVLMIPRAGRLRRRVWVWQAIRLAAVLGGAWWVWRFAAGQAGLARLALGGLLVLLAVLAGPVRQSKPVDAQAAELGALVVLNGGTFVPANGPPTPQVRIFVSPKRLYVLDSQHARRAEIPLARLVHLAAGVRTDSDTAQQWELNLAWQSDSVETARFRFEGVFAEHLARVAETTIRNLMKRELRVFDA